MKIAITALEGNSKSKMDARFGRAKSFMIYDQDTKEWTAVPNAATEAAHGAGPLAVQTLSDNNVNTLITGNGPGGNAARGLQTATIEVYLCKDDSTVEEALNAFEKGELNKF